MLHVLLMSISFQAPKPQEAPITKVKIKNKKNSGSNEELFILKDVLKQFEQLNKDIELDTMVQSWIHECDTFYMGIGVHDSFLGITKIAPGSPAEKAGLIIGDILLEKDIRDKYKEGTAITIQILRNGIMYYMPVVIGKICTGKKP